MKHLTLEDREILADLLQRDVSQRGIGERLNRSHTTIGDEIKKKYLVRKRKKENLQSLR